MLHRRSLFSPATSFLPPSLSFFSPLLSQHLTPFLTPLLRDLTLSAMPSSSSFTLNDSEDERFHERGRQNDASVFFFSHLNFSVSL